MAPTIDEIAADALSRLTREKLRDRDAIQREAGDEERERRAELALFDAGERFAWPALAQRVAEVLEASAGPAPRRLTTSTT